MTLFQEIHPLLNWQKRRSFTNKVKDYEISEANRKTSGPSAERVLFIAMSYYRVEGSVKNRSRGVWNAPRKVVMYLCRQMCWLSLIKIKNYLIVETYTAARYV